MIRPPVLMHVKIKGENGGFGLWLPLFLIWPLLLVVLMILSPLLLVAVLALWPSGWGKRALLMLKTSCGVLYCLRGLKVDVGNVHQGVYISVV